MCISKEKGRKVIASKKRESAPGEKGREYNEDRKILGQQFLEDEFLRPKVNHSPSPGRKRPR